MSAHLAIAKKCNPDLSERFNLFTKEREHSQASESDQSGEGAKDLVSIVEFQVTDAKLSLSSTLMYRLQLCTCDTVKLQLTCGTCLLQTNLKLALQAHSDTLRDIRGFWRELCSKKTTFASLSEVWSNHAPTGQHTITCLYAAWHDTACMSAGFHSNAPIRDSL